MTEPLVSTTRLRALRSALGTGDAPVIMAIHDYPDPDAIASALAVQTLAASWGISSVIAHGGFIGREENAEMVRLLKIELIDFESIPNLGDYQGAVFLDTQPASRNQSVPASVPVLAVVDHHIGDDSVRLTSTSPRGTVRMVYSDVRSDVGATSTLALGYLATAGIVPDARLATALFLGITTDTDGLLRDANPADVDAYTSLLPLSDLKIASQALHPPLDREYFQFLHMAVGMAVVYGASCIVNCGEIRSPDRLSTASDTLIGVKGASYALAVGFHESRAYLSLRVKAPRSDATRVLMDIVEAEGKGGGHNLSAGGFVDLNKAPDDCFVVIRQRFLEATADNDKAGEKLI